MINLLFLFSILKIKPEIKPEIRNLVFFDKINNGFDNRYNQSNINYKKIKKINKINKNMIILNTLQENNNDEIIKLEKLFNNNNFTTKFSYNLFKDWNFDYI